MTKAEQLLDKAKNAVSPANYSALAARMGVSRQNVSRWKQDLEAIPEERIAQLAQIAHLDPGEWLVAVRAEQAQGESRKAWAALARRIGAAAAVSAVALLALGVIDLSAHETIQSAAILNAVTNMHYAKLAIGAAVAAWALQHALSRSTGGRRDASPTLLA